MIITKIQGGLGNQLFQYAIGHNLAIKNNTTLKLDISWYKNIDSGYRKYELDNFNIKDQIATEKEIKEFTKTNFLIKIKRLLFRDNYIKEKGISFDKKIPNLGDNKYLEGYWQSEKYFLNIAPIIKKEFTLKDPCPQQANPLLENIKSSNSVSVHIRRGDYLATKFKSKFALCTPEYYKEAISLINSKITNPRFFVFSDDIENAKTFDFPKDTVYIDPSFGLKNHQELVVMSLCKHNIIANSSFSWWSAWLNNNESKIVIAPKKYYIDDKIDTSDWTPKTWIRI